MYESLVDKRVVITAAAGGIGRAMAEAFLAAGARVHVCDLEAAPLDAFREAAPTLGTTVVDVAAPEQVARLFAEAEDHLGGLDVLVNNAGIAGPAGPVEDCALEDWRRTIAVGLDGAFHCLRHAVPLLKAAGAGSIINISSTAGVKGGPVAGAAYVAAKHGVVGLSRIAAAEYAADQIRVNCICPAVIETPLAAESFADPELRAFVEAKHPIGRVGRPEDVAAAIAYLGADEAAFVTGTVFPVDGGFLL